MRAVNLLPEERREQGESRYLSTTWVLAVGAGLLALACIFILATYLGERGDVSTKRDQLSAIEAKVADARAQQASTTASLTETQARLAAFNAASSARIPWDTLLGDVSRVLPAGSWLSSLSLQAALPTAGAATGAPVTAPTAFVVSGFALSHRVVAQVMQRLALVPMLTDVTLQRSQRADVGAQKAYGFTMSANVLVDGDQ